MKKEILYTIQKHSNNSVEYWNAFLSKWEKKPIFYLEWRALEQYSVLSQTEEISLYSEENLIKTSIKNQPLNK